MPEIEILPDAASLAVRAAGEFVRLAVEALGSRGRFCVALAGGSTPGRMYSLLAGARLDWQAVHVFWGDERCVPPGHVDSNYRLAAEALLDRVSIPPQNVHRIHGELPAEEAAREYELELRHAFDGDVPHFDLVLLGLGPDGHTASLFPGTPALHTQAGWTAVVRHRVPPPPLVDRVTLTPLVINAAANVIFLVSGAEKSALLADVLHGPCFPDRFPAQAVRPGNGSMRWLVDQAAAEKLEAPAPFLSSQASITSPFWSLRQQVNAGRAILHQWERLEASGCIENFRIAAGTKAGLREGWYFADSDAYKWLDAAARIYFTHPSPELKRLLDGFISLLSRAQAEDGYLYTYNQIHFPGSRWENLLIEHEVYCLGHLIEAGVSHYEATRETSALLIARKAADLLVRDFLGAGPDRTDGHEEIEIALLRLYQATGHAPYMDLASSLLERRGRAHPFFPLLLRQNARVEKRKHVVKEHRLEFLKAHPRFVAFQVPEGNYARAPGNSRLRWVLNALTGKYFQMHTPIRKQTVPVGHAVRFGYLETATAMLARLAGDESLLPAMQCAWERMVTRFMYVSGGLGAVPGMEGFGRDDELDPLYAYAETCAALACMFWNWELARITGQARYSDLFEWQLYNAAAPGMGLEGDTYLYNNPLACHAGVRRRSWFAVPCCPSNLSRTWASLGQYIYSADEKDLWVHQYIGSKWCPDDRHWSVEMDSSLPWEGRVALILDSGATCEFTLHLRLPSWAGRVSIRINNLPWTVDLQPLTFPPTASGYDPRLSRFLPITRTWAPGDVLDLAFEMPVVLRRASQKVRGHKGRVALTRGPLLYCLENVDNPGVDIFSAHLDPSTLRTEFSPSLLGGAQIITGRTTDARTLTFIPYHLWANRGESQMTVWVNAG